MTVDSLDKEVREDAAAETERTAVDTSVRRIYRMVDDGLSAIGGIEPAAGLCGLDRGALRRSLDRNGRWLAVDHVLAIAARMRKFNASLATKIGAALVYPIDLVVFPRVTLKVEDKLDRAERLIRSMPMGEQMLAAAYEEGNR